MNLSNSPGSRPRDPQNQDAFAAAQCDFPINSIWRHSSGGDYKIVGVERDATGYERRGEINIVVRYEQQFDAQFPQGTMWVREVEDFRRNFTRKESE